MSLLIFRAVFLLILVSLSGSGLAQISYKDYKGKSELNSYAALRKDGKTAGYHFVFRVTEGKQSSLVIHFMNSSADELAKIELPTSTGIDIIESSFNGEYGAILFLNSKEKQLEAGVYSIDGQLRNKFVKRLNPVDLEYFKSKVSKASASKGYNQFLHEVDSNGFLLMYNTLEENLYTCSISKFYLDSSQERVFNYMVDQPIVDAKYLGKKENTFVFSFEKMGKTQTSFSSDIVAVGTQSLDQLWEITQNERLENIMLPNSLLATSDPNEFIVLGRFFKSTKDMVQRYHDGIALWRVSLSGEVSQERYHSFQDAFQELRFREENSSKELGFLYPHLALQSRSNEIFLVSEGYRKHTDASQGLQMGVGLGMGNFWGPSSWDVPLSIRSTDMVITEFDSLLNYKRSTIFPKVKNTSELGYENFHSVYRIGQIAHQYGLFDFLYAEVDKNMDHLCFYYKNYNRGYNAGGVYRVTKLKFDRAGYSTFNFEKKPNTTATFFLPWTQGNLMIMEYIFKRKTLYFDLMRDPNF